MNKTDLLTMNQIIDLIATYKGEAIPDDLFDAMIALLKKVNDSRLATHIVNELNNGLTDVNFIMDAPNAGLEAHLTIKMSERSTLYEFIRKQMTSRCMSMWHTYSSDSNIL